MLNSSLQRLRSASFIRSLSTGAFASSVVRLQAHQLNRFPILKDTMPENTRIPSFMVGTKNGFLPRQDPMIKLPDRFVKIESLLQRMSLKLADGSKGLLAYGRLSDAVHNELDVCEINDIVDERLLSALYRDYTFLASAYLLEPCDIMYRKKSEYGLGKPILPRSIAVPLVQVAEKIGAKPFMEYALSYSLYNWQRINPFKSLTYDNLDVIRSFAGTESEKGFILNHVTMVAYSGDLIQYAIDSLDAVSKRDRPAFNKAMKGLNDTYESINNEMEFMWSRSEPADYQKFRTFIMGTKNQPMFPNGVIYEGVSDKPLFHRGESGANDSMIPLGDNILQLTDSMPNNPLTEVLRDFRSYRPTNHKEFLEYVQRRADEVELKKFALQDDVSAAVYLANVDQIRAFRHRHWNFTKEYILKYSSHPVATGGSPIITWLPNQLGAVLDIMVNVGSHINPLRLDSASKRSVEEISKRVDVQKRVLVREVAALKKKFKDEA